MKVDNRVETKEFIMCSNWTIPPPWIIYTYRHTHTYIYIMRRMPYLICS